MTDSLFPAPAGRLKIAFVSDWFLPRLGGIELQMRDLALELRAEGHEVEVIAGVDGPADVDGIKVLRLPGPRLPGGGIAVTPRPFQALGEAIGASGYDVIHAHCGIITPVAHAALHIAARRRLPAVATFHSVLRYYDLPLKLLDRAFGYSRWPVRYVGVSSVTAEAMRPLTGGRPVAVIPNGIDLDWWRRPAGSARDGAAGRPVEFVSVMRLEKRKRPRALVLAFAAALEGLPSQAARLTIVGDGGERAGLEKLVAARGLADRIRFAGSRPRPEIRDLLHGSDVFALASRLEAFGIAALEARAAGLPVITLKASGARDFLDDGKDALLAEDDSQLADALRRLVLDPALRGRLAAAAAVRPEGVDWTHVGPRYLAEYRAAIAAAGE
ncbi:glycosyltransferase family 4 protein [Phreatobacter sp. AB_2022a]|uniref:glycosyltransferase family 4 protein n=1 Tax=Phreatobacter sp. AB_2022a TaxID=3003134 RepID=UPI002286F590|nr:glycosyltransferase family 4 protein [Phreatobacter sp. AB_2022a]MCZ0732942.1 glycosyltransferase family 4 protein [Phreatobacter sp. AB_2022a]